MLSVLLEIKDVCSDNKAREVDSKKSAERQTEASLSNDMDCCVHESYDALERCKHMRR